MNIKLVLSLMVAFCGLASTGCSSFPGDFKAAVAAQTSGSRGIEGPWEGTWLSNGGHHGQLRCILTQKAALSDLPPINGATPVAFAARFEAKFWEIFTAHYTVELHGISEGNTATLSGDQDLGWLVGGKYHYEARVTPEKFDATYHSKVDSGKFQMERPARH